MTMKFVQLKLHWEVEEADRMIEQLDHFRDALWSEYGEEIIAMRRKWHDEQQCTMDFGDDVEF